MTTDSKSPISDSSRRAQQAEQDFIAAAEAAMSSAPARVIPGQWFETNRRDSAEEVHKAMVDRRLFGTERRKGLPQGATVIRTGWARRFLFGRRLKSVTVATVLAPPGPLLDNDPRPVTLSELSTHIRNLISGQVRGVSKLIIVCSPTGFAPEVWTAGRDWPGLNVILSEPLPGGGWKTMPLAGDLDIQFVRSFDPESENEKRLRVRQEIDNARADLLLGGISARKISQRLNVRPRLVESVLESMSQFDEELQVSRADGDVVLYRGLPGQSSREEPSMSAMEWIRSLFAAKGDEAGKINHLIENRNKLATRRDRLYEDIARLEKREQSVLDEGKQSTSIVVKRRVASQVAQLRKEIARWNTTASMLNQQINVLSTDIHNLTLLQQGQMAKLPTSEELTEHAVAAEEMLETLGADARMVEGLEAGIAEQAMSDDEAAILNELQGDGEKIASSTEPPGAARKAEPPVANARVAKPEKPQAE